MLGASRQVIVGDIALIRAGGTEIIATPRGYVLENAEKAEPATAILPCIHDETNTENELNIFVDNGCKVINVIIDHPLYGQFTGNLDIATRYDVKCFMDRLAEYSAQALSKLTGGVHLHTVSYPDDETLERVKRELSDIGVLYEV